MRIGLIHALRHSPPSIEAAFKRLWPEPKLMNLMDESLSGDLAAAGRLDDRMTDRFMTLGRYVAKTGADAILFTCSAFGPCIEAVARDLKIPVLKPNEAMIEEAEKIGGRIGLLATFQPTLVSMPPEFPKSIDLKLKLADGALAAMDRGDLAEHDRLSVLAAKDLMDCTAIALAQFSLSRATEDIAKATGKPILTTPDSAVRKLKRLLEG